MEIIAPSVDPECGSPVAKVRTPSEHEQRKVFEPDMTHRVGCEGCLPPVCIRRTRLVTIE